MAVPPVPADNALANQNQQSLLVIEDDAILLDSLMELLRFEGYEVLTAYNGSDGLAVARASLPQGILLDIKLPDMDGYAVLRALKRQEATRSIPTIVLSGYTQEKRRAMALKLGAVAYISKPFDTRELLAEVRRSISGRIPREPDPGHR